MHIKSSGQDLRLRSGEEDTKVDFLVSLCAQTYVSKHTDMCLCAHTDTQ